MPTESAAATAPAITSPEAIEGRPRLSVWFRRRGWRHLVAAIAALFALFPVAYVTSAAFNSIDSLSAATLIPESFTLDNFAEIWAEDTPTPLDTWLWASFRIALLAAIPTVLVAAFAAYAFSRLRFFGRRALLTSLLVMQIFPQFLGFVAFFALAREAGEITELLGLNSHFLLILIYLGGAAGFNAFLLKGYLDSIPDSLDEAAVIDGAGEVQIFFRIILPLARPMLAVIFILSFVATFNEYILAATLLSSAEQFTLPVGLQVFLQEDFGQKWGLLSAVSLVAAVPVVVVFLAAQRQILGGLTAGGVKN